MPKLGGVFEDAQILRGPPSIDGIDAARRMNGSDIPLSRKWLYDPSMWQPHGAGPMRVPNRQEIEETDLEALQEYVQGLEANHVIPPKKDSVDEDEEGDDREEQQEGPDLSLDGPSGERDTKELGVGDEYSTKTTRDLRTGETTSESKHKVDSDFGGKWEEAEVTVVEGKVEDEVSAILEEGSFGDENSSFSGKGSVFSAEAGYDASASVGNKGLKLHAGADAEASMMEGSVETNQDGLVRGDARGAVAKADAEATVEVVLSPEEATLGLKLSGSGNIIEGEISGETCFTPRRAANLGVSAYNWIVGEDYEGLGEEWEIGLCVGGEVGLSVGAQAGVEAEAGYKDGTASAEAGAKIGFGVGASAKVKGSAIGVDKVLGWFGL
ncbi:hypothetical protein L0F51_19600 [Afifella sp. H1R]|uniref:hypothetical protein n=1 Tax=Afifella sp. H1R TaxID=2908841 RepID=UPI001F311FC6|nr:hypothetical protein [Afifella sp. H1R]MCF1505969.1 hypothetical protein [Afifella sp. H1R]